MTDHNLDVVEILHDILMLLAIKWGEPSKHYSNDQLAKLLLDQLRDNMRKIEDQAYNEHLERHYDRRKNDSE